MIFSHFWALTRVAQIVTQLKETCNLACTDPLMNPDRTTKTKLPQPTRLLHWLLSHPRKNYSCIISATYWPTITKFAPCISDVDTSTERFIRALTYFSRSLASKCENQISGQTRWHKSWPLHAETCNFASTNLLMNPHRTPKTSSVWLTY